MRQRPYGTYSLAHDSSKQAMGFEIALKRWTPVAARGVYTLDCADCGVVMPERMQ
jgi:hypothetical protein